MTCWRSVRPKLFGSGVRWLSLSVREASAVPNGRLTPTAEGKSQPHLVVEMMDLVQQIPGVKLGIATKRK